MERIDLHTHTLASDGSDTPAAVVQQAAALGLRAVAVTDHDTFAGLPEALAAGQRCGIEVVPGVDGLIHISQISDHHVEKASDVLSEGQEVDAKIIDVDKDRKRISLPIRALLVPSNDEEEA